MSGTDFNGSEREIRERLSEAELASFEALLDVPDPEVLAWILGEEAVPEDMDSPALRRIIAFHRGERA